MNQHLHEPPADDADELEPGFAAEFMFSIGLGLVTAGIGAFTAMTVALMWSALF